MNTFIDLSRHLTGQPPEVGVILSRIDVGKGREGLYLDQRPEVLQALAKRARVESIRASTAIEGYDVDAERAAKLVDEPGSRIRNRNEREFAGYRDAIEELMGAARPERISIPQILHLHRRLYAHSGGRGGSLKREDNEIVEYDEHDGSRQLIFAPPAWEQTEFLLGDLIDRYNTACDDESAHPLVLLASFVLDFLAIHPVADGNGRLARLLTTHELLRQGYGVARYVSVEQRIFESKHSYYQALRESQARWHDGQHDVWPWVRYLTTVIAESYDAFEQRIAASQSTVGLSKQEQVVQHVSAFTVGREFRLRDLRAALPGISDQTFRLALGTLRGAGKVRVDGAGQGAVWQRTNEL